MIGFSKNMSSVSSSLAKFNNQLPDLVKNMRGQLQELHKRKAIVLRRNVIDAPFKVSDAAPDAKGIVPELIEVYRKPIPHSDQEFVRKMNKARESAIARALAHAHERASASASADAMPLYKNQLIRWGGAALGSQVLRGAG